jgi:mannose-1-phosphate guanylyltransferase/mannose-6-phosphate isomerase
MNTIVTEPHAPAATVVDTALTIQPVILAGGSGTRLWPLSREHYPKQLLGVLSEETMLEATTRRLEGMTSGFPVARDLLLVCGEDHRFLVAEQIRRQGRSAQIFLEPMGRNTAPALSLAALAARANGGDAILVVMPADHAVTNTPAFQAAIDRAAQYAAKGGIVTLGIVPHRAETGYGYIKTGAAIADGGGFGIDRFVEKPARELAESYLESGGYLWNSGIFVVRASTWLDALQTFQPKMFEAVQQSFVKANCDGDFTRIDRAAFAACPSDSIDYAVMEKLGSGDPRFFGVVVPLQAGWSDVGAWDAVWDVSEKDENGNVGRGRVMFEDSTSSFAHSEGRLIACVGLDNVVVVETPDAVLVADKANVQKVKAIVARINAERAPEAKNHRKVHRPWGYYDSIDMGGRFQVKRIVVNPGAKLSLQMHYHRAEHWIVVTGTAEVTCGDKTFLLTENQSTYIPLGNTHRLANPGKTPLEIIEVQSGSYLGEDDIVRFEDTYGRN